MFYADHLLNTTDGVEAIAGTMDQYCIPVGGNVTLVAFNNITGNPEPQSSWELIGGTLGGDTTTVPRGRERGSVSSLSLSLFLRGITETQVSAGLFKVTR